MQNCIILHCWRVPRGRLEQSRGTAGRTGAIDGCSYYQPIPAAQVNMFLEMRDKRYIYKLKLYVHVLPYQRHTFLFNYFCCKLKFHITKLSQFYTKSLKYNLMQSTPALYSYVQMYSSISILMRVRKGQRAHRLYNLLTHL